MLCQGLLSDLLLRAVLASVVHALGEVVDEPDALCDADLLLLGQLGGQASLTGGGMVHRHIGLLLEDKRVRVKKHSFISSLMR